MAGKTKKPSRFPETRWSVIGRANASDDLVRQQAVCDLLSDYAPALRSFLIQVRRVPVGIADDLLHDFVVDKVLTRKIVANADRGKGKFRNYVLKLLNHYVSTKMGKAGPLHSAALDIDDLMIADPASLEAALVFDRQWVQRLVRDALELMAADCATRGRQDLWRIFELRVADPMLHDAEPADYEQIIALLNIPTPRQAINLLVSAKRCFTRHLRAAIGRYAPDDRKIDAEILDILEIIGR